MITICTNEWTSVNHSKPPAGRVVWAVNEKPLPSGSSEIEYICVAWNGMYWVDGNKMIRTPEVKDANITAWYMFEKFNPRDLID